MDVILLDVKHKIYNVLNIIIIIIIIIITIIYYKMIS